MANRYTRCRQRRMKVEALECRRLLATGGFGLTEQRIADPDVLEAALISFHGDDLTGKDGPMAKVGFPLTLAYHEFLHHAQGGTAVDFAASNRALQTAGGRIFVEGISVDQVALLQRDLQRLGFAPIADFDSVVSGWLPIGALEAMAATRSLEFARPVYAPKLNAGRISGQGDEALRADEVRAALGVDGSGIKIGVLSDSFDALRGAAGDIASGDLPASGVEVIEDLNQGSDEGRAMLQIVHDVAPAATLAFATAFTGAAGFARNIVRLADAGADIIVDDVGYLTEPFFQDGIIARAAQAVVDRGIPYFSSAGNSGTQSYESRFVSSGTTLGNEQGDLHDFDPSTTVVDTLQQVTIPVFSLERFTLEWDEPFGSLGGSSSTSDVDIYLLGADGTTIVAQSIDANVGRDPVEFLLWVNDGSVDVDGQPGADTRFNLAILHRTGPAPGLLKYLYHDFATIDEFATDSSTLFGHPNAAGAMGVAASAYFNTPEFGIAPPQVNDFSSKGGGSILFDGAGTRLSTPEVRVKPEVTGPDGVNTTFFGSDIPNDVDNFPNFFGTSAAAPHLAAVAALMLDAAGGKQSLTPAEIRDTMIGSAIDITKRGSVNRGGTSENIPVGVDTFSGAGLVNADQAVRIVLFVGEISGTKFLDLNGDGARDAGEPGVPNFIIHLDPDNDGIIGYNEPTVRTDRNGFYRFTGLGPGTYTIREVATPGFDLRAPLGTVEVTLRRGVVAVRDFANAPSFDWGDAGPPFPTTRAENGPSHGVVPGLYLGSGVDSEFDFVASEGPDDQDDGVTFSTPLIPGSTATMQVQANHGTLSPALLQGWIDFDGDGRWSSPGEQIARDVTLRPGSNVHTFSIPVYATPGARTARFRYGYERGIGPTGPALAGEVEDHVVDIVRSGGDTGGIVRVRADRFRVDQDSTRNPLDVLANDVATTGTLRITAVGAGNRGGAIEVANDGLSLIYSPARNFVGTETFVYTAGNGSVTAEATVTMTIEPVVPAEKLARMRLAAVDGGGAPLTQLEVGQDFVLEGYVEDLRTDIARGVFAAFVDVNYPAGLISVVGPIEHGPEFGNATSGSTGTPGLIDEVGGIGDLEFIGGGEFLIFRLPMRATAAGVASFPLDPADIRPAHDWLLFDRPIPLLDPQVELVATSFTIVGGSGGTFTNRANPLDVNVDGTVSAIDALLVINELNGIGARNLARTATPQSAFESAALPAHMVDVNSDGHVTAIDALLVINQLNRLARRGAPPPPASGESVEAVLPSIVEDVTAARAKSRRLRRTSLLDGPPS